MDNNWYLVLISAAVAQSAFDSGVARIKIFDINAYKKELASYQEK